MVKRYVCGFLVLFCFCYFVSAEEMSKDERKNIQRYSKDLKNKDESVRYEAAERLRYYKYPESVSLLSAALQDPAVSVRNRAALSLFEMKETARPAIPSLLQALQDTDGYVRINAGAALINMDVERKQVLPAIQELLQREQPGIQIAAVHFLQGDIPFPELMPVLTVALKNPDPSIREKAAKEFQTPKDLPPDALPILVSALSDSSANVRKYSADALGTYKTKGTPALAPLIRTLNDPDPDVRFEAIDSIERMGTWAKEALPALHQIVKTDAESTNRQSALRAYESIDPEGKTVVPLLIEALKDKDPEVREEALDALSSLRPFPYPIVPQVQAALAGETDERVQRSLQRVIERGEREKSYGTKVTPPPPAVKRTAPEKPGMSPEEASRILQEKEVQMTADEFWHRVGQSDAEVVTAMLAAGFPPNSEMQGMSVLMLAVRNYNDVPAQKEIIQALIDAGADVNYRDENNTTPFFYAAGKCDTDQLKSMIQAGAVLEVTAKGSATTLSEAVMANKVENVRLLLKSGYKIKNEPSWLLATAKNPEIAAMLRKAGVR